MASKEQKDDLLSRMRAIDSDAKIRIEEANAAIKKAKKDAQDAVAPLRTQIDTYFEQLHAKADEPFKLRELSEGRKRALEHLDRVGEEEGLAFDGVSQAMSEIENAIGWVEPKPVDDKVIEEVKKRDRAADMEARAAKGIGVKKE
jgi:hypothetical protein